MAVVEDLLVAAQDGTLSFGNYTLAEKKKIDDFPFGGDLYKVKTFHEMTKLEKNGMFSYESVPGTSVIGWKEDADGVTFTVEGNEDAQIIVGLAEDTSYSVTIQGQPAGVMNTGLGGKLNLSVELAGIGEVPVVIKRA